MELQPPLYTVVDTEALTNLFESTKNGPRSGAVTLNKLKLMVPLKLSPETYRSEYGLFILHG